MASNSHLVKPPRLPAVLRGADPAQLDKGGGAAKAALAMLALKERFGTR